MTIFHAIIFGIVEGVTEFLPVSSTAHLEISAALLKIPETDFLKTFLISIQLGAFVSASFLLLPQYLKKPLPLKNLIVGFIPTGVVGLVLYPFIKKILLGNTTIAVIALIVGGIIIILVERFIKRKHIVLDRKTVGVSDAFILGCAQALAVIPGVSRSGAMIVTGLLRRIDRAVLTEFTFLLGIPTIFAATGYDLWKNRILLVSANWVLLSIGFFVSTFVSFLVMRWFLRYISRHTFSVFGWYRIIFAILFILLMW